jgi:hypothetical protein
LRFQIKKLTKLLVLLMQWNTFRHTLWQNSMQHNKVPFISEKYGGAYEG